MPEAAPYGGRLMFAQSWEDPQCDRRVMTLRPGENAVSITSGGDNTLAFLLDDPAKIWAIDINPAQAWLFELKRAAFLQLDHVGLTELLGVFDTRRSAEHYRALREHISPAARAFFDQNSDWFSSGLLGQGGFERYYAILRSLIRLTVGRATMERLFTLDQREQRAFYDRHWDGWRWRTLMKIGCSKPVLGNRLDPSWFRDSTQKDFGGHFRALTEHALVALPARDNYFLAQIMLGRYLPGALPDYLREENFATIRDRIERVEPLVAGIEQGLCQLPARSVDAFALSNVFEYSPVSTFDQGKDEVARVARPEARLSHRNLLAPRRFAEDDRFVVDDALSAELRAADRGFIYSRFEAGRLA